jgi:hypothetical protein
LKAVSHGHTLSKFVGGHNEIAVEDAAWLWPLAGITWPAPKPDSVDVGKSDQRSTRGGWYRTGQKTPIVQQLYDWLWKAHSTRDENKQQTNNHYNIAVDLAEPDSNDESVAMLYDPTTNHSWKIIGAYGPYLRTEYGIWFRKYGSLFDVNYFFLQ